MSIQTVNLAPTVEIITIGDEILIGQTIDTNSAWMAKKLNENGFQIIQITTIQDNEQVIIEAIQLAFSRVQIVLMTGGLGPTKDDVTKNALCSYFNTTLEFNKEVEATIRALFVNRPEVLNELTLSQAFVPASATVIQNKRGSAPATWFDQGGKILVSMPGVPFEMEWVMSQEVLPRLALKYETPAFLHKTVVVVGIPESTLALRLEKWEENLPKFIRLAYLPSVGLVKLRLSGLLSDRKKLEEGFEHELVKLRAFLGSSIFAEEDIKPEEYIGRLLREKGLWIATAESCTGGNIAHQITSVSGCSEYFLGSVVAYKNEVKTQQLNVSMDTLRNFGAVSREVVEEMAEGVRENLHSDIGVAVTGIAGPNGASDGKPVGTVWIGVCNAEKHISRRFQFGMNRKRTIEMATLTAFMLIKELLEE